MSLEKMFKSYCLLLLAVGIANVHSKVAQPTNEQALKVASNEESGPSRTPHAEAELPSTFGKVSDDETPRTTMIEERITINSIPYERPVSAHAQSAGEGSQIGNAVVAKDEKETDMNEDTAKSPEGEDKKEKNIYGMFNFLWSLFGMTTSKKEVEQKKKKKEIVGGVPIKEDEKEKLENKEEKHENEISTTATPPKEKEVGKVLPESDKKENTTAEAVTEIRTKTKFQEEEKSNGEKKHKNKTEKLTSKTEVPAADKKRKHAMDKSHSEENYRFSDELMMSDIVDSEGSSESSSSEENDKKHAGEKKTGDKTSAHHHQRHHHDEPKSGLVHFGIVKTLALVTAGPALIIAVVVLLSRAHIKKRDSTMM